MNEAVSPKGLPVMLRGVCLLFYALGTYATINVGLGLLDGNFMLDLNVLGIPCAYGLSRISNGWRWFAIAFALFNLLVFGVAGVALISSSNSAGLSVYLVTALGIALPITIYAYLTSNDVSALFKNNGVRAL